MIVKDMKISEAIARWPELAEIFFDYGMGCVGCPSASFETIEDGALKHGLSDEEINDLIDDLNKALKEIKD